MVKKINKDLNLKTFPRFRKQNLRYFGRKDVETGPSGSHELATFLKYHMTLMILKFCILVFIDFFQK